MKAIKVLSLTIILALILVGTTGCGKKKVATPEDFGAVIQDYGYEIRDVIDSDSIDSNITEVAIVAIKDETIIQFFILKTEEDAKNLHKKNTNNFATYEEEAKPEQGTDKNYEYYKIEIEDKYMVSSRIENTYVYVNVNNESSSEIKEILKKLGY